MLTQPVMNLFLDSSNSLAVISLFLTLFVASIIIAVAVKLSDAAMYESMLLADIESRLLDETIEEISYIPPYVQTYAA